MPPASRTGAPRHTPALLRRGNGSEKAGPELCGRGSLEGTGFPAAAPGADLHPRCRRGGSSTSRGAATLPKAAAQLSKQLHKAMINTPHPHHRSSWGSAPASGALPGGELPAKPHCLPRLVGLSPTVVAAAGSGSSFLPVQEVAAGMDTPPPRNAGAGGDPCTHLCIPVGRGACGERGSSTQVHAEGSPQHHMSLWLFGTRHLRRSRPARSCTVGGSAAW